MIFYIKQKLVSMRDKFSIKDESGTDCYKVWGKYSIPKKFVLEDNQGNKILDIKGKVKFMQTFDIFKADKKIARIKMKFAFFKKKFAIETDKGEYKISGNVFAWEFDISKDGKTVAAISKKIASFKDCYRIEVLNAEDVELVLAAVIVIDHCYHSQDTGIFNQ